MWNYGEGENTRQAYTHTNTGEDNQHTTQTKNKPELTKKLISYVL